MCGFSGFLTINKSLSKSNDILNSMLNQIVHRGPDDSGLWSDNTISMGHRRLAIHDLSPLGKQPMHSSSDQFAIVFNGEIYNYETIRSSLKLKGFTFKSDSDTEVLLSAIEYWGISKALSKFVGMFAFALWDKKKSKLTLARDRVGEKPLYYGMQRGDFLFGSQLSALTKHPSFIKNINRDAVALYLRHGYIPTPHSIYQNISKLLPGTFLDIELHEGKITISSPVKYWDLETVVKNSNVKESYLSPDKAINELDNLLTDSVHLQSKADVPLGAFLSGGIDSTLIATTMQSLSSLPVNTFTIGFNEKQYDEAVYARDISKHLGTNHTELYIGEKDLLGVVPNLSGIYDEPFADSSQIPTVIVGQLAKQKVTVSLSGDGGDELFCGYSRYFKTVQRWDKLTGFPSFLSSASQLLSNKLSPQFSASGFNLYGRKLNKEVQRTLDYVGCNDFSDFYKRSVSSFSQTSALVNGANEMSTIYDKKKINGLSDLEHMMYSDTEQYLVDDILVKVDRAFMSSSLEGRVPLLDHRIIEFAWQVPIETHCYDGRGKYLLRSLLNRHVPNHLLDRPKMGFGVPLAQWLRGPLLEWAESLLTETRLKSDGVFDVEFVTKIWFQHKKIKSDWSSILWSIVMFNAWYENQ
jgi:asparagine synthase (glutamine-hydrolysing)